MRVFGALFLILASLQIAACGHSDSNPAQPPAPPPVAELGGAEKATGATNAHFVYCKSADLEAGIDFGTAVLGNSIEALSGKIGNRATGTPSFSICAINSISRVTGTNDYGIVCTDTQGKMFVYSVSTADYKSAQLNFSDWDHTFEKTAVCTIYQTNPLKGTQAWP